MALTRVRAEQISDIDYKQAVRVLENFNVSNLASAAPNIIDGVLLSTGDRILVAGQDAPAENGLYYVVTLGSGSNGVWSRTTDGDVTGDINAGMIVMVTEGNTYADTLWKLITDNPIVIGTSNLVFTLNSTASFDVINANGTPVSANTSSSTINYLPGNNLVITGSDLTDSVTFAVADAPEFTGNISTSGNLFVSRDVSITGNLTIGANLNVVNVNEYVGATGNISFLGNLLPGTSNTQAYSLGLPGQPWSNIFVANLNVANFTGTDLSITGTQTSNTLVVTSDATINGNLTVLGTTTTINSNVIVTNDKNIELANNISTLVNLDGAGLQAGNAANTYITNWTYNYAANAWSTNVGVSAVGNITGNVFSGNGALLSNINAANITGAYGNANVAAYLPTYTGNVTAGNVSVSGNTQSGNLFTAGVVSATGNIRGGNINTAGDVNANIISATGNVTGNYILGNIAFANGLPTTYSNSNVANYLPTYSGDITAANISITGLITATTELIGPDTSANLTRFPYAQVVVSSVAANIQKNEGGPIGLIAEGVGNSADTSHRGVGVYGVGYTSGAAHADGVTGEGHVSASGDTGTAVGVRGYADDVHAGGINIGLYGTAINAATNYALYMKHGNILSFDSQAWTLVANTASALSIESVAKAGILNVDTTAGTERVTMSGNLSVVGNITGAYILGNGSQLTGILSTTDLANTNSNVSNTNSNVANLTTSLSNTNSNVANTNSNVANLTTSLANTNSNVANITANVTSLQGQVYTNANVANYLPTYTGNITANIISTTGNVTSAGWLIASNSISAAGTLSIAGGNLFVNGLGNVQAGNLLTAGQVSAQGNITGSYILGNGSQLTGLPATYANANVANYLPTYSGNITSNNLSVTNEANVGILYASNGASVTGTMTATYANAQFVNQTNGAGWLSAAGNIYGNNSISVVGNIAGNLFIGNGSQLTGLVSVSGTAATVTTNAQPNITSVGTLSALTVTGNTQSGNLLTAGYVSATGNVTGNFFIGDGSQLTNVSAAISGNLAGNLLANGFFVNDLTALSVNGNIVSDYIIANASELIYGNSIAIGNAAASNSQSANNAIAIGYSAGYSVQGANTVAIGAYAGANAQGNNSVAIGYLAGNSAQADNSIIINASGTNLGGAVANALYVNPVRNDNTNTSNFVYYNASTKEVTYSSVVSITGALSGSSLSVTGQITGGSINPTTFGNAVAIGTAAGYNATRQNQGAIAIGYLTGVGGQGNGAISIGEYSVGDDLIGTAQGNAAIAIGSFAAYQVQGANAIAIGANAGLSGQGVNSIAIGANAAPNAQPANSIVINATGAAWGTDPASTDAFYVAPIRTANASGILTYNTTSKEVTYATGISVTGNIATSSGKIVGNGWFITSLNGTNFTVLAFGTGAGSGSQGNNAIALGTAAAQFNQSSNAIAIGSSAAQSAQGNNSIAIGNITGQYSLTGNSIAIGHRAAIGNASANAAQNTANNIIALNATGANLYANTANAFYVNPVRNDTVTAIGNVAVYNATSKEIAYSNVINLGGNITGGNILTAGLISATGNVSVGNLNVSGNIVDSGALNIITSSNGNITLSANGTGIVAIAGITSATGNILTAGNITGNVFIGNGSQLTGIISNSIFYGSNIGIGSLAGQVSQGANTTAVGYFAGQSSQGLQAVAVGYNAGQSSQGVSSVAVGAFAGSSAQGAQSVAVGLSAGKVLQGPTAVAIGYQAGQSVQGGNSVAIGYLSGYQYQGEGAVAVGAYSGGVGLVNPNIGLYAVAVGFQAGSASQANSAIAIGYQAGFSAQGLNSIAIGRMAAQSNQPANSIVINATGSGLTPAVASSFYVAPVRNDTVTAIGNVAVYNASTKELAYSNTISLGGSITSVDLSVTGTVNISNVTVNSYTYVPQTWFKGTRATSQNVTTSTDTTIIWNSNNDPLSWGNTTTGRITPNKSGWYEVTSRVLFSAVAGNSSQQINHQIAVNGTQATISQAPNSTNVGSGFTMVATAMVNLNGTTDYITTSAYSTVAANAQQIVGGTSSMILVKWVST